MPCTNALLKVASHRLIRLPACLPACLLVVQLAALHSASSSNGSSSSGGCGLHTLSIEYAPGSRVYQLSCNFKDHPCQQLEPQHHHNQQLQLPTSLKHLTTPLPGQHHITSDCKLAVQCSLQESHESYLAALAAGLPDLHSLTVIGTYEGQEEVLTGYKQLQQLRCSFGGAFRCVVPRLCVRVARRHIRRQCSATQEQHLLTALSLLLWWLASGCCVLQPTRKFQNAVLLFSLPRAALFCAHLTGPWRLTYTTMATMRFASPSHHARQRCAACM